MRLIILTFCIIFCGRNYSQIRNELEQYYFGSYSELENMLNNKDSLSFKRAVFIAENAFFNNELDYNKFNEQIKQKVLLANLLMKSNHLKDYHFADSNDFEKNGVIFKIMTDTIFFTTDVPISFPYRYNFDDFFGRKEWDNMFVSKLLTTRKGNCHSMPYLYKILADEMGTKAYLSFAPNHLYIKQRSKKYGWYNTELTSSAFPIDAWIMTTGYISREAIISGIYMDTLSDKQSIALCLVDLAHSCRKKSEKDNTNQFVIQCCDLALKHFPNYLNALLLKLETLKKEYKKEQGLEEKQLLLNQINKVIGRLIDLGYREIPQKVYLKWLSDLQENKDVYQNKKLSPSID